MARLGKNSLGPIASCKSSKDAAIRFCLAVCTSCGEPLGKITLGPSSLKDGCGRWFVAKCRVTMPALSDIFALNFSKGNDVLDTPFVKLEVILQSQAWDRSLPATRQANCST